MEWFRQVEYSELTAYESLGIMRVRDKVLATDGAGCSQRILDDLRNDSFWLHDQMLEDGELIYYLIATCGDVPRQMHVILTGGLRTHMYELVRLQKAWRRLGERRKLHRRLAAVRGLRYELPCDLVITILLKA